MNSTKNIAVVVTHGIGNQKRYDFLKSFVEPFRAAVDAVDGAESLVRIDKVELNRLSVRSRETSDLFGFFGDGAPATPEMKRSLFSPVAIDRAGGGSLRIYEAYWADEDMNYSWIEKIRFEFWLLGTVLNPLFRRGLYEDSPEIKRVWLVRSYNPWESGPENSPQFRDWQFRRATQVVFGQEVSWTDRARLDDLGPLNRRAIENLLNVAALLFMSMFLVSFMLIPRWSRISHLPAPVRKYGTLVLLLPFVMALALSPIFAERLGNTGIIDLFTMAWADTVRANPVAAWSTVLLVLWLMYALLGKQFSELEPDNQPAGAKGRSPFGGGLFS